MGFHFIADAFDFQIIQTLPAKTRMLANLFFDSNGVTCIYEGSSSMGEMLEAMNSIGRHDRLKRIQFVIHDFLNITDFDYDDYAAVMTAAQIQACISANAKIKFAIVSDDAYGDIAGQILSDLLKRPLHVFTTVTLAMVWLRSW
jgi:hypothetical protein